MAYFIVKDMLDKLPQGKPPSTKEIIVATISFVVLVAIMLMPIWL